MEPQGVLGGFYRLSDWIMRLAYVNLLWISFTLLGGILFGIMPATIASFAIIRKWVMDKEEDYPIFKTFWESYRKDFINANLLGVFLFIAGGILYLYNAYLNVLPNNLSNIFQIIFYSVVLTFGFVIVFIFPVFVHYNGSLKQYFINSIVIALSFPHYAILMLFIISVSIIVFQFAPILALFFGVSINVFLLMKISFNAFTKIALKQNQKLECDDKSEQISV
ncbi:YesL family protein [Neobacillus niacini]|uniref:YesL family protein n=1 Tax=Neobacillus niacini TaxID=86668 RepID=UPI003000E0DC